MDNSVTAIIDKQQSEAVPRPQATGLQKGTQVLETISEIHNLLQLRLFPVEQTHSTPLHTSPVHVHTSTASRYTATELYLSTLAIVTFSCMYEHNTCTCANHEVKN